jgi:hypothetical protein
MPKFAGHSMAARSAEPGIVLHKSGIGFDEAKSVFTRNKT